MTEYDPDFVAEILAAAKAPPEAVFDNVEDVLAYLGYHPVYHPSLYVAPDKDPA